MRTCARPGCSNPVKKQARRYCSMDCTKIDMREFRRMNMRKTRAKISPEEHSRIAKKARAKAAFLWRARMFREEVNRLPARLTREDLYIFATRIYEKGRWAKNRVAHRARKSSAA